jgi:amino acid transporter
MSRRTEHEDRLDTGGHDTDTHHTDTHTRADYDTVSHEDRRRERFGGTNWGAAFFGWLVAIAVAVLLISIAGAVAAGAGSNADITQSDAEREAGTIGIVAAVVLLVVLMIAYYAGGYVAGRMSRFDGGRQGLAVWLIGLIITLVAVGLGILFGNEYNILGRMDLPTMPIPTDTLTWGGVIAAAAVVLGTLLAAMTGGKVGQHYHRRVDKAGLPR